MTVGSLEKETKNSSKDASQHKISALLIRIILSTHRTQKKSVVLGGFLGFQAKPTSGCGIGPKTAYSGEIQYNVVSCALVIVAMLVLEDRVYYTKV